MYFVIVEWHVNMGLITFTCACCEETECTNCCCFCSVRHRDMELTLGGFITDENDTCASCTNFNDTFTISFINLISIDGYDTCLFRGSTGICNTVLSMFMMDGYDGIGADATKVFVAVCLQDSPGVDDFGTFQVLWSTTLSKDANNKVNCCSIGSLSLIDFAASDLCNFSSVTCSVACGSDTGVCCECNDGCDCPTSLAITITGAANQDSCTTCNSYNTTFNVAADDDCNGADTLAISGCGDVTPIEISWVILCNDDQSPDPENTPHLLIVALTEDSGNRGEEFHLWFAAGDPLNAISVPWAGYTPYSNEMPCFWDDTYTNIIAGIQVTATW